MLKLLCIAPIRFLLEDVRQQKDIKMGGNERLGKSFLAISRVTMPSIQFC